MPYNKNALIQILQSKLGKKSIEEPTNNENAKTDYMLKKKYLESLFKNSKDEFIDENIKKRFYEWGSLIPMEEFINHIVFEATKMNNTKFTQGYYHMYMDYIHALFDIKCYNFDDNKNDQLSLPNYNIILENDKALYDRIYPKRKEFIFAWWVMNITRVHFAKYMKTHISYQVRIDGKIFDIFIEEFNLIIEYQEATGNHDNKNSDLDKKAIIRGRGGKVIEFFQESIYNKKSEEYLEQFWDDHLQRRISQALIKNRKENNYLETYVFKKFIDKMKILKKQLRLSYNASTQHINKRIKQIDDILKENNNQIKTVFRWKYREKESIKNGKFEDAFIISVEDVSKLIGIDSINQNKIKIIKEKFKELVIANKNGLTDWNGVITFLLMVDSDSISIDPIVKRTAIDYLLSVQNIYEFIMDEQDCYHNSLYDNYIDNSERRENYIKKTAESKYEKTITNLSLKNEELQTIVNDYTVQSKKIANTVEKVCEIINDTIYSEKELINKHGRKSTCPLPKLKDLYEKTKKNLDILKEYKETIHVPKKEKIYNVNKTLEINKPIIDKIPELIYTGTIRNKITINDLKSFFVRNNIPLKVIKVILFRLSPYAPNPDILLKVKLNDNFTTSCNLDKDSIDDSEESNDSESDLDKNSSDDETDNESNYDSNSSDIESNEKKIIISNDSKSDLDEKSSDDDSDEESIDTKNKDYESDNDSDKSDIDYVEI